MDPQDLRGPSSCRAMTKFRVKPPCGPSRLLPGVDAVGAGSEADARI